MSARRIVAAIGLVLGLSAGIAQETPKPPRPQPDIETEAVERGRRLAEDACATCHAIGLEGDSAMPEAPPFREVVKRYPLEDLEEGFAEGLVTGHPAMPEFVFRASEIDDLLAYLETLEPSG